MSRVNEALSVAMTVSFAIFSLCPILTIGSDYPLVNIPFERIVTISDSEYPYFIMSLAIILVPVADLFLDYVALLYSGGELIEKRTRRTVMMHLSDFERLLFIIGIGMQSVAFFLSKSTDDHTVNVVLHSICNSNTVLLLAPILSYLRRCTTSFTPIRSQAIYAFSIAGLLCRTVGLFSRSHLHVYRIMVTIGGAFAVFGCAIYLFSCLTCLYNYIKEKLGTPADRLIVREWLLHKHSKKERNVDEPIETAADKDSEVYRNYVPAFHMLASILLCTAIVVRGCYLKSGTALVRNNMNYVVLCAEILVLIVEIRIRKNEITRGLVALLRSKKSYVRYISHELRTPLNTAFLGLKLLTNELRASSEMRDAERYDTLCDVNMSCTAAVSILNDLLCYEKLESGRMQLHKESVTIGPFLDNCMLLFSAQAQECGVSIDLASTVITPSNSGDTSSLQAHDSVFVDRFKMDQVFRNLLSNALKFTPRGGNVTVRATFQQDRTAESTSASLLEDANSARESIETIPIPTSRPLSYTASIKQQISDSCRIAYHRTKRDSRAVSPGSNEGDGTAGKLVVVVTDTGAGISAENQKRLFKEIVQFSPEKLQSGGGSGLGLWITAGILDLHGGSIRVHSDGEQMGTSFTVEIPMIRYAADSLFCPTSADNDGIVDDIPTSVPLSDDFDFIVENKVCEEFESVNPIGKTNRHANKSVQNGSELVMDMEADITKSRAYNLLVVDDSRLNRKMLLKCLKADGHSCHEAEDGLQAIALVQNRITPDNGVHLDPFDAILMDFVMPNMDGPEATKEIRALGYTGLIFGVTGNGLSTDVEHFLSCGADRVLLKPLDIDAFGAAMRELSLTSMYRAQGLRHFTSD